jgi:hypothetical protein
MLNASKILVAAVSVLLVAEAANSQTAAPACGDECHAAIKSAASAAASSNQVSALSTELASVRSEVSTIQATLSQLANGKNVFVVDMPWNSPGSNFGPRCGAQVSGFQKVFAAGSVGCVTSAANLCAVVGAETLGVVAHAGHIQAAICEKKALP